MITAIPHSESDDDVMAASLTSPEEFGVVFERHFAVVLAYLRRRVGVEAASELASETFLRAFALRHRYRAGPGGARPWLLGIATVLIKSHRRAEGRQMKAYARGFPSEIDDPTDRADARLDANERARALTTAIDKLSTIQRNVLLLHAWADLTPDEIATALDLAPGTVRSHLSRARQRLSARRVDEHSDDRSDRHDG